MLYGADLRTTQPKPLNKVVDICHATKGQKGSAVLDNERTQAVNRDQTRKQARNKDDDPFVPRPQSDWENQENIAIENAPGLTTPQRKKQ